MCENAPAVKALNFLKIEVSKVVNHDDPEEAAIFRSLLRHLLSPSMNSTQAETLSSKPQIFLARPLINREPSNESESSNEEAWTNALDEEEVARELAPPILPLPSTSTPSHSISGHALRSVPDPLENGPVGNELSADRFQQRTEVFEGLLEFISEEWKQPSGSLLDMINCHGEHP
jgi:hypothetical protein